MKESASVFVEHLNTDVFPGDVVIVNLAPYGFAQNASARCEIVHCTEGSMLHSGSIKALWNETDAQLFDIEREWQWVSTLNICEVVYSMAPRLCEKNIFKINRYGQEATTNALDICRARDILHP